MGERRTSGDAGKVADAALWCAIILAPVAGGSSHLYMLPVLGAVAVAALAAAAVACKHAGRSLHAHGLAFGLLTLAIVTLLQALPLPSGLHSLISPTAHELQDFVSEPGAHAVTYESGATMREAAKLIVYALIASTAYERVRARKRIDVVVIPVAIAGVASAGIALVHRGLGLEKMLGILPAMRPASDLLTTFVNPNHAAGFMMLAALASFGLAVSERAGDRRIGFAFAGVLSSVISVFMLSRGGLAALAIGLAVFGAMLIRAGRAGQLERAPRVPLILALAAAIPVAVVVWRRESLIAAFTGTGDDRFAIADKIAAVRGAWPMFLDHFWTGIGRGSYASAYPRYQVSDVQLTFAYPENIVAQLACEWGAIAGAAALAGLVLCLAIRIAYRREPEAAGALAGVTALLVQNLVDFSLELPGVAIPVAALIGGAGARAARSLRARLKSKTAISLAVSAPSAALIILIAGVFQKGDLGADVASLDREIAEQMKLPSREPAAELLERHRVRAERHPANALIAARMSYLGETGQPPDLKAAIRWANRTLFLAPRYADGHLAAGRLLAGAGHRKQGFAAMRRGLELASNAGRLNLLIGEIAQIARSPGEILEALPRRDAERDVIDERYVWWMVSRLQKIGKDDWAQALVGSIVELDTTPLHGLEPVVLAAMATGANGLALKAAERLAALEPNAGRPTELLAEATFRSGDYERLKSLIAQAISRPGVDPIPLLRLRLRAALERGEIELARETVQELERRISPTKAMQSEIARLISTVERQAGNPSAAVRAVDKALQTDPGSESLRMERATVLLMMGRHQSARADLEYVLNMKPDHPAARAMLVQVRARLEADARHARSASVAADASGGP